MWLPGVPQYVKPTTAATYQLVRSYVLPHPIAQVRLDRLRPDSFRVLFAELADRGGMGGAPLGDKTVSHVDRTLRAALNVAVGDGLLAKNPTPERRIPVPRTERPWLEPPQLRRLLEFVRFRDPDLEVPVRLASMAGLRRGEIAGLRWADVDPERGVVHVRRSRVVAQGLAVEGTPKSGQPAVVPVNRTTLAALERHRTRRAALIEADCR